VEEQVAKIKILQAVKPRTFVLAAHPFEASAEKDGESPKLDPFLLFGDNNCVTRPQVPGPAATVEVDTSDSDMLFPACPLGGDDSINVIVENDGSSRCRVFIAKTTASNAEEGDLT
jgi:hypothetical protein